MTNKTRFAPSPTGLIHLGNVRTALFSFLAAKAKGGNFLLRIEDTDQARSQESYTTALMEDLVWLGLVWDEGPYKQSERTELYEDYYAQLIKADLAYPCYCSEAELALSRKVQLASSRAPRYAGTCAHLSTASRAQKEAAGLAPSLRFRVPNEIIAFVDGVQGPKQFNGDDIGDFIIRRSDGGASFMFSNAIDDALMDVTEVIRGEDHLTNTPRQLAILKALDLRLPSYAHLPMIVGADGKPLSKRNGSENISALRSQGYFPIAILNHLARLGHHYVEQSFFSLAELAQNFDLKNIGRSSAHFDLEQLKYWQKTALMHADDKELAAWLYDTLNSFFVEAGLSEQEKTLFLKTVRANILFPIDALDWAKQLFEKNMDHSAHAELFAALPNTFLSTLKELLNNNILEYATIVSALKEKTGLVGKNLFMPLRILLSGKTHGPELAQILALLGKERILSRISQLEEQLNIKV